MWINLILLTIYTFNGRTNILSKAIGGWNVKEFR